MCKVLLAGYYGFNNIGDEAILEMFLKILVKKIDKKNIRILTADPEKTEKKFKIKGIDRYSFYKVNKAIKEADVVLVGGGSLLQDVTSKKSIYYYLYIIYVTKLLNKKIGLLSQGIGPIKGKINRFITGKVLKKVDYVSVRDEDSMHELISIGLNDKDITFAADPVINYKTKSRTTNRGKIKIGFSIREWGESNIIEIVKKLVERFDEDKFEFIFIPFHYDEDVKILNNIEFKHKNCIVIRDRKSIDEIYNIISNLDLMVGVRLHSLIFASAASIPVVGISYDPKVKNFLKSIGEKNIFEINSLDGDKLYQEIIYKLEDKKINKEKIEQLKKTEKNNIKIIERLIEGCTNE
jgi:polysaccharide pyruvyl transferase CsaB